jgi:hypothetical protein
VEHPDYLQLHPVMILVGVVFAHQDDTIFFELRNHFCKRGFRTLVDVENPLVDTFTARRTAAGKQ